MYVYIYRYCRFHLVCPGIKFGERNFFWAWYKMKLICLLYFHFVPSPEKVSLAKFFPGTGGGQTKWNRQYKIQEGLKPDRNNAREGRIVGRDAMRRALGAASALLTRRYHAARRPRGGPIGYSADRAGGAIPADVCAHTVAHRSWCLTPGRSALPTKITVCDASRLPS